MTLEIRSRCGTVFLVLQSVSRRLNGGGGCGLEKKGPTGHGRQVRIPNRENWINQPENQFV